MWGTENSEVHPVGISVVSALGFGFILSSSSSSSKGFVCHCRALQGLFSPTSPCDCSLQLPHAKLECFTAAASGLAAREDGEMNTLASLNLCFCCRWCRGPSSVPSSALQLQNLVLHHAKDASLAPCPGINAGSLPAGVQPSAGCSLSLQIQIHFPLSSRAFSANRHWYS